MLWLRFRCRYRTVTVFADSEANGRRDQLWDRDVAEVFLQTDPSAAATILGIRNCARTECGSTWKFLPERSEIPKAA